jgi:hypothetical protein
MCRILFEKYSPQVRQFALCIWSAELNPEKYEAISKIMSKNYENSGINYMYTLSP